MLSLRLSLVLLVACQAPPQIESTRLSDDDDDGELAFDRDPDGADVLAVAPSDCSFAITVPGPQWQPTQLLRIPVVVHIIADAGCTTGAVSDQTVANQIAALNEDYRAKSGTPGGAGVDSKLEFFLATTAPNGQPTTGITRDCNATWYLDRGSYWTSLAWDTQRYLNVYVNSAGGSRGYVPFLPADPAGTTLGTSADRVVINQLAFGRPGPFAPYNQGRTATHEIGHYLGLFHTYFEGCGIATAPNCYTTGDRLCDTTPNATSHKGCPATTGCGGVTAPVTNYMELTDDACMTGFTAEQAQRMRCTLATYRPSLAH